VTETSINTCHVEDKLILLTTVISTTIYIHIYTYIYIYTHTHTHTHTHTTFINEAYQIQMIRLIVAIE